MGHNIGVSGSYYKPTEKEVLVDYLKIMDQLIINDEFRLSQQVQELKEQNEDKDYVIKGKLQEKEEQINNLQESIKFLSDRFNAFLISQPENKIVYDDEDNLEIKGIELKPEINNKVIGKVIPSTFTNSRSNNKKS
jgi:hypothetical protein